jgi:hypothetical protein
LLAQASSSLLMALTMHEKRTWPIGDDEQEGTTDSHSSRRPGC